MIQFIKHHIFDFANIVIAASVLYLAWKTFWLTTGHNISAFFSISRQKNLPPYISSLILENRKNRPEIIKSIHLRIGKNIIIELRDHDDFLILKPLEAIKIELDPVSWYSSQLIPINVSEYFNNRKIKKTIIITTTQGIIETKNKYLPFILNEFFKNYYCMLAQPINFEHNTITCSLYTDYIVSIKDDNDIITKIRIEKNLDNYEYKFKYFSLSKEEREDEKKLKTALEERFCKLFDSSVKIMNIEKINSSENPDSIITPRLVNPVVYHIIGPIISKLLDIKLYFVNKRAVKILKSKKQLST